MLMSMPLLLALTRAGADIALCIIAVLFLAHSALIKNWEWTRKPEIKALGALWLFMMLSSVFSPISIVSSLKSALIWGRFVLFYAAARFWLITNAAILKKITLSGLCILAFLIIDTAWQYKTGTSLTGRAMFNGERLTGPLTKANIGVFLLKFGFPILGITTYLLLASGHAKRLWMPACGALMVISLIMVSGERSTVILMLLSLGVIGLTLFVARPFLRKWVLLSGVMIGALIAWLAATQPVIMYRLNYTIEQVSDFQHTYYGQMFIAAARLWWQNPLTGIGAQQFLEACKPQLLDVTYCDVHPHNMYMEWLVSTGLPGIGLFILAMALILRRFLSEASFKGNHIVLSASGLSSFAVLLFPFVITQSVFTNWAAMVFWYSMSLGMSMFHLTRTISHDTTP